MFIRWRVDAQSGETVYKLIVSTHWDGWPIRSEDASLANTMGNPVRILASFFKRRRVYHKDKIWQYTTNSENSNIHIPMDNTEPSGFWPIDVPAWDLVWTQNWNESKKVVLVPTTKEHIIIMRPLWREKKRDSVWQPVHGRWWRWKRKVKELAETVGFPWRKFNTPNTKWLILSEPWSGCYVENADWRTAQGIGELRRNWPYHMDRYGTVMREADIGRVIGMSQRC